jgi:PBP1b-binding outer membrane lipoprotein LpoB
MTIPTQKIKMGETITAILTNVKTGKKRVIGGAPETKHKYRVKIEVYDLKTGEIIHTHEEYR